MSNYIAGDIESFSSDNNTVVVVVAGDEDVQQQLHVSPSATSQPPPPIKRKRNLPGTPDPAAEVIALSPTTLTATNRFVCEVCGKGFQRDQNLQLHRRGHNLPWKLRQRAAAEARKRVYVCPEPGCVHHDPARALGDLTGIKKHFGRKHGEKKWGCDRCSKNYAVPSDLKAHSKACGSREYKCDCGTVFSRMDSFLTHRAFCDALADDANKDDGGGDIPALPELLITVPPVPAPDDHPFDHRHGYTLDFGRRPSIGTPAPSLFSLPGAAAAASLAPGPARFDDGEMGVTSSSRAHMSATALLHKAAQMGAAASGSMRGQQMAGPHSGSSGTTVDFLGVGGERPMSLLPRGMDRLQFDGSMHGLQHLGGVSAPHGQNAMDPNKFMWGK